MAPASPKLNAADEENHILKLSKTAEAMREKRSGSRGLFPQLESPMNDIVHMSRIATDQVERAFSYREANKVITGKNDCYYVNKDKVDAILFSLFHLQNMIRDLREQYYEALEGAPQTNRS